MYVIYSAAHALTTPILIFDSSFFESIFNSRVLNIFFWYFMIAMISVTLLPVFLLPLPPPSENNLKMYQEF